MKSFVINTQTFLLNLRQLTRRLLDDCVVKVFMPDTGMLSFSVTSVAAIHEKKNGGSVSVCLTREAKSSINMAAKCQNQEVLGTITRQGEG